MINLHDDIEETCYHDRGYLPHIERRQIQTISFRLYDSVPKKVIDKWKEQLSIDKQTKASDPKMLHLRQLIYQYEDSGYGCCDLKDHRIASLVTEALKYGHTKNYNLIRWCIMPNHVHVIVEMINNGNLSDIVNRWKSYTAHKANKLLRRTGQFWMSEYFDRYIRDAKHMADAISYVDFNPVKANLVQRPEDWSWSSVGENWNPSFFN